MSSVGQDRDPDPFENDPIRKNKKWIVDPRSTTRKNKKCIVDPRSVKIKKWIVDPDSKIAILPNILCEVTKHFLA